MQNTGNKRQFGKFERKGSTFTFKIVFYNGKTINGHSKPAGQTEPYKDNKLRLLENILTRLLIKNNYLKDIQYMTVHRCTTDFDKDNIELFTLFPNKYELSRALAPKRDEFAMRLREILDSFYNPKSQVYGVTDSLDTAQILGINPNPQPTPTEKRKYKNFDELVAESKKLVFSSHNVLDKYIDKNWSDSLTQDQRNSLYCNIIDNPANKNMR